MTTTTRRFEITLGTQTTRAHVSQAHIDAFHCGVVTGKTEDEVAMLTAFDRAIKKLFGSRAYWRGPLPVDGSARGQVFLYHAKSGFSASMTGSIPVKVAAL